MRALLRRRTNPTNPTLFARWGPASQATFCLARILPNPDFNVAGFGVYDPVARTTRQSRAHTNKDVIHKRVRTNL
eukprot:3221927-Rhodomonas_salina.1